MATSNSPRIPPMCVAVLAGGDSHEREISLQSGAAVTSALTRLGHAVVQIDPSEADLTRIPWESFDVAFLALHGTFGEDGQVQCLLGQLGVPFTGSSASTARLAFSKSASKERLIQHGVPTPPYVLIHESNDAHHIHRQARKLGYPLVLKPDAQGSSLGVSIVNSPNELPRALTQCFHFDAFGVLEAFVQGTEWTLGLLDDLPLPLIKIETSRAFFDYDAKYIDPLTRYHFDVEESAAVVSALAASGQAACKALGTCGLVRADIMLDRYLRPWVLEVNTTPGLTDHSLIPKAAAKIGISFDDLCERAIQHCLRQTARKHQSAPRPHLTRRLAELHTSTPGTDRH